MYVLIVMEITLKVNLSFFGSRLPEPIILDYYGNRILLALRSTEKSA